MTEWTRQSAQAAATAFLAVLTSAAGAQTLRMVDPGTHAMVRNFDTPTSTEFNAAAAATNPFGDFRPASGTPMVSVKPIDPVVVAEISGSADLPMSPGALVQAQKPQPVPHIDQPLQEIIPPQNPLPGHEPPVAPERDKYIPAGYAYHRLDAGDKVYMGFRDLVTVGDLGSIFLSAGYSHLTNGAPNYGTDKGAFGQRLGAAALRETTQGILTDAVFSPLFREDPRYFTEGPAHPIMNRAFHVVTRVFVTRKDAGGHTANLALLLGYAATTATQSLYYPKINRNARDAASEFGGSLGGAALGFAYDEFADDLLIALHLKKKP